MASPRSTALDTTTTETIPETLPELVSPEFPRSPLSQETIRFWDNNLESPPPTIVEHSQLLINADYLESKSNLSKKTCATHAKDITKFTLAILSGLTFAVNAMMAPTGKGPEALASSDPMTPAEWVAAFFFGSSSLVINAPQTYYYLPVLIQELQNIRSDEARGNALSLLFALGTAVSAAALGYKSFEWIPTVELFGPMQPKILIAGGNSLLSFAMTLATRFVGLKDTVDILKKPFDETAQFQQHLIRAIKKTGEKPTQTLKLALISCAERYPDEKEMALAFLQEALVIPIIEQNPAARKDVLLNYFFRALSLPITATTSFVFAQLFIDGIEMILHELGSTDQILPLEAKQALGLIMSLSTAALFITTAHEAPLIIFDSLFNRSKDRLLAFLLLIPNALASASLFVVAKSMADSQDSIFSDILPPTRLDNPQSWIFPALCTLGAFFQNAIALFHLTVRNPLHRSLRPINRENITIDDIVFIMEKHKLSKTEIATLTPHYPTLYSKAEHSTFFHRKKTKQETHGDYILLDRPRRTPCGSCTVL